MTEYKGTLIPIGGNEDKGMGTNEMYTLDFIERGILSRVVKEAGGTAAKIVVITTASSIPVEVGNNYLHAFRTLGCTHVDVLHIRSIEAAEDLNHLRHIHNADCVLFSGGDQSKIVKYIGNTQMHVELVSRLMDGKFVLAGTSAGAMSMSHEMIAGSGPPESLIKGNIKMSRGMSLLDNVIIDTHFIQRGRFGRLAEAVARHPRLLGIGLAEDTGLVIRRGNDCEVIGSGMVILFDPRHLSHNNYDVLESGTPMSLSNLTTHVLATGDRFKIRERSLKILPLESYLEAQVKS